MKSPEPFKTSASTGKTVDNIAKKIPMFLGSGCLLLIVVLFMGSLFRGSFHSSGTSISRNSNDGFNSAKRAAERKAISDREASKLTATAVKRQADTEEHQAANKKKQVAQKPPTQSASHVAKPDPNYPLKLVTILSETTQFSGLQCALQIEGDGWHKSEADGRWNAVLRRSFGENEISCLLESVDVSTVQRVELEAEFYQPGLHENEMMLQFGQSAQVIMHPMLPPKEFTEAVINKATWSNDQWALTRDDYANGGFGLKLRKR